MQPDQVRFTFPVPGWFEITPPVGPGTYEVDLFGRRDGDVSFVFLWTVPG